MEKCVERPLLFERQCGGWLAISGADEPVKIGVTAETQECAVKLFDSKIHAWRASLAERGSRG